MEESNKQKSADALIRNSIMGALASSTLALILWKLCIYKNKNNIKFYYLYYNINGETIKFL